MSFVRSLDSDSLSQALGLHDHCIIFFYSRWSQHKSAEYLTQLSEVETKGGRHSHFSFFVRDPEAEEYIVNIGATELPVLVTYAFGIPVRRSYIFSPLSSINAPLNSVVPAERCLQSLWSVLGHSKSGTALTLLISGDRSSVGKSTFSLFLMASLLQLGFPASSLAYIKPVTQCEAEQPISIFCKKNNISCQGIGPVVFYSGFTRAFLDDTTKSSAELLQDVREAVAQISVGKRVVLVDGVGYPAVGSICGVSNADVAAALNVPVLLVGKSGVGDAVDSFNLNASFFELKGVRVLGTVFNKIPTEGFYSLEASKPYILSYFQKYRRDCEVYGLLPQLNVNQESTGDSSDLSILSAEIMAMFMRQVDVRAIFRDLWTTFSFPRTPQLHYHVMPGCHLKPTNNYGIFMESSTPASNHQLQGSSGVDKKRKNWSAGTGSTGVPAHFPQNQTRILRNDDQNTPKKMKYQSREEIQRQALQSGATGG